MGFSALTVEGVAQLEMGTTTRAEVRRLTDWFLVKAETDVTRGLVRERVFKLQMPTGQGGGAPDSTVLRTARGNIRQHMRYLGWLAQSRNWLAGEGFTAADLAAFTQASTWDFSMYSSGWCA